MIRAPDPSTVRRHAVRERIVSCLEGVAHEPLTLVRGVALHRVQREQIGQRLVESVADLAHKASLFLVGGLFQINPIWQWGPYHPYLSENGAQPDWYIGWLIGALRLMPNFEPTIAGRTIERIGAADLSLLDNGLTRTLSLRTEGRGP